LAPPPPPPSGGHPSSIATKSTLLSSDFPLLPSNPFCHRSPLRNSILVYSKNLTITYTQIIYNIYTEERKPPLTEWMPPLLQSPCMRDAIAYNFATISHCRGHPLGISSVQHNTRTWVAGAAGATDWQEYLKPCCRCTRCLLKDVLCTPSYDHDPVHLL
jgi:hypothetical protein